MGLDPIHEIAAAELDDTALAGLFTRAYEGYPVPMHVDGAAMRFMLDAFDLDRHASRVLVCDGAPVAVAMLGRRGTHGWIGGMGVVAAARRRGLARRVMQSVIANARALGVTTLDLEVLVQNREAIPLYESLGFRRTRRLEVWRFTPPAPPAGTRCLVLDPAQARADIARWRRTPEPWQRADASLDRFVAHGLALDGTAAVVAGRRVGAAIHRFAGVRVSVLQLAVAPDAPRDTRSSLLAALARPEAREGVRWLNLPEDDPATAVVRAWAGSPEMSQWEMRMTLG